MISMIVMNLLMLAYTALGLSGEQEHTLLFQNCVFVNYSNKKSRIVQP